MGRRETLWIVIIVLLLGLSIGPAGAKKDALYPEFGLLAEMIHKIRMNYVEDVDEEQLIRDALAGVVSNLDPYSQYLPPKKAEALKVDTEGAYGGLGIQITVRNRLLTVVTPIEDTPAFRAGIMAGDIILAIDGKSTKGITIDGAVETLRGKPGSKVVLTIGHNGAKQRRKVTLERAKIRIKSIKGLGRSPDGEDWNYWADPEAKIGYLRVTQFQEKTVDLMDEVVKGLLDGGVKGLIVDLRFNPGGLLPSAIEMSDRFIKEGLIVFTKGRAPESYQEYPAKPEDDYPPVPLVILVNGASASASEIVAGCIQAHKRGVLIGDRTFGKGSVQCVYPLDEQERSGRSAEETHKLKLTTAHYYTPTGQNIHRVENATDKDEWGVTPDLVIKVSRDEQYALIRQRNEAEVIRRPDGENETGEAKPLEEKEDQSNKEEPATREEGTPDETEGAPDEEEPDADENETPEEESQPKEESKGEDGKSPEKKTGPFVDRQLQRAIEVLKDSDLYQATLSGPGK